MSVLRVFRLSRQTVVLGAALVVLAGCDKPEPTNASGTQINEIIAGVNARGGAVNATLQPGQPPLGSSGPTADVAGISSVVNGGSASVGVTGASEFQRMYVQVLGADGYYELQLPSASTAENLILSMPTTLGASNIAVRYTLEGPGGVGTFAEQNIRVIIVGTGDVQISIAWSGASDVDLHVVDPAGERVYFGNPISASGGRLDLDSNAACSLDNKNNENIVWPLNGAPSGTYEVYVDYFDDCGVARSDWVVTVQRKGHGPEAFQGSFVGLYSANPQVHVGSFSY